MAIAYYIPDQAKLAEKHKPKVIKKVKIPLNDYTLGNNSCWELMAQVFCYALRYHYLTAGNGVLQISVEFTQQQQPANTSSESMMTDNHHHDDGSTN
ncbi:cell death protein Grim-like [Episyrphus balteatus]|uniref:cell death protein Grim-like n=1 Tax=Episyrphus balteatus TaxID=286459 RepID=UPI0024851650|nr:cell death protein Grim-like [Episyrphus balteatus]